MAPNISPPGSRSRQTTSAAAVDTATRMASFGDRRRTGGDEARHQARPPPSARRTTARPECRGSAPPRAWSARWRWRADRPCTRPTATITWASAPGLAPNSADCASQPCTKRRYELVAAIMHKRRDRQHRDAERKRREPLERLRRHHGAERNADQDRDHPRQRRRNMHRPAAQRRRRHAEQRAGDEAGGKAQPGQRDAARRPRSPASRRRAAIRFSLESGETPSPRSMPRRAGVVKPHAVSGLMPWRAVPLAPARSAPDRRRSWRRACP